MSKYALVIGIVLLLVGIPAMAASFPAGTCPPQGMGHDPLNCNVQITANPDHSVSLAIVDPTPYELSDDMQVGIFNNSDKTLPNITLHGTAIGNGGIFGFDGDEGWANGVSFSNFVHDQWGDVTGGTVNFAGGLAPGQATWFDLEEAPDGGQIQITPEPGSLFLLGTGLLSLIARRARKARE